MFFAFALHLDSVLLSLYYFHLILRYRGNIPIHAYVTRMYCAYVVSWVSFTILLSEPPAQSARGGEVANAMTALTHKTKIHKP